MKRRSRPTHDRDAVAFAPSVTGTSVAPTTGARSRPRVSRRWTGYAAAMACWGGWTAPGHAQTVRTWPTAVVMEDEIRLGDLCALEGLGADAYERVKEIVVADAPPPGGSRIVRLDEIRKALSRAGVNQATLLIKGASRCGVSRPAGASSGEPEAAASASPTEAATPKGRTLREAVEQFFRDETGRFGGRADVQFGRTSQQVLDLSGPPFEFVVQRRSGRAVGLVSIDVLVQQHGETVQVVPMVVNARYVKTVVVAQGPINASATIRPEDLQVVEMTFDQVGQGGVSDPAEVIGQRAKRFIPPGEIIDIRNLERVPLVHRGQVVDVHTTVGGVRIVTAAKAMQNGGFGDVIELRSGSGKRSTVSAVVTGPRRVEIAPSAPPEPREGARLAQGGGA